MFLSIQHLNLLYATMCKWYYHHKIIIFHRLNKHLNEVWVDIVLFLTFLKYIVDKIRKQISMAEKVLNLKSKDLDPSARVILAKVFDISESQSRPCF